MTEYRDIVVVFMALALVSVLIFVAASVQAPAGQGLGEAAKVTKQSSVQIRFGEPVIDVKEVDENPFAFNEKEESGSEKVNAISKNNREPPSFTEYVFPINTNGIRKAIESIAPALSECYQQWRSLDENVGVGAWEVQFYFSQSRRIEKTSRVRDVKLNHSSPDSEVMEQCMMEMFGMLRFEAEGPRKFSHPLVFQ